MTSDNPARDQRIVRAPADQAAVSGNDRRAEAPNDGKTYGSVDPKGRTIHTNTVEGAFSIFKRGMKGVYQHCGEQHLHRYLAEFEFRYNTRQANGFDDRTRAAEGIKGIVGKRLTYARPDGESVQA